MVNERPLDSRLVPLPDRCLSVLHFTTDGQGLRILECSQPAPSIAFTPARASQVDFEMMLLSALV